MTLSTMNNSVISQIEAKSLLNSLILCMAGLGNSVLIIKQDKYRKLTGGKGKERKNYELIFLQL